MVSQRQVSVCSRTRSHSDVPILRGFVPLKLQTVAGDEHDLAEKTNALEWLDWDDG